MFAIPEVFTCFEIKYFQIRAAIQHSIHSTFDEYASEVQSGKLEWSPPHMSENFWKQNASKLNERDYELLRFVAFRARLIV